MAERYITREQARAADRRAVERFGVPSIVLMENAGRGAAELLLELGVTGRVVVCAGKGNNGGDGFVVARRLRLHGRSVHIVLFCKPEELRGDAETNFAVVRAMGLPVTVVRNVADPSWRAELDDAQWVVDALLGTGARGEVREPFVSAIEAVNAARAKVLAVDLPSGLDCDTGQPLGACVRADHTVTFVAQKVGFRQPSAAPYLGSVHVLDIGLPAELLLEG